MISLTHAELTTPLTQDECLQNLRDFLALQGFASSSWKPGDPIHDILTAIANRDARKSSEVAFIAQNRFNATATDPTMMERIAESDYGNTRATAVKARHSETFSLVAGETDITIGVGEVVVAKPGGRITYRNLNGGTIPSGGSISLEIEAEAAGVDGNADPGEINQMVTTLAGVTCSNTSTTRMGRDAEGVEALRLRNVQRWPTLSLENTAAKVEYTIKTKVPNITSVVVDGTNPRGAGTVDIYCASADGAAGPADLTAATTAAHALFFNPNPRIQVLPAIEITWNPTGTILYDPDFSLDDIREAVEAKLTGLVRALPIGAFSYVNGATSVLMRDDITIAVRSVPGVVTFTLGGSADVVVGKFRKLKAPDVWAFTYAPTEVS